MSIDVDLQVASNCTPIPTLESLTQWVTAALDKKKVDAEISIRIVDTQESQTLNHQYRQKDKPTNVLSFPAEIPDFIDIPLLGDLVICAPVVNQEAADQQKSTDAHWAHMVIHGTLHLLGYDHIDDDEAEEMEAIETRLLATLNFPCPY